MSNKIIHIIDGQKSCSCDIFNVMEDEQINEVPNDVFKPQDVKLIQNTSNFKKHFCTVTPLSKYLAMALFVALPFLGFWGGVYYSKSLLVNEQEIQETIEHYKAREHVKEETIVKTDLKLIGGDYYKDEKHVYKASYGECKGQMGVKTCAGPAVLMSKYDVYSFNYIGVCQTIEGTGAHPPTHYVKDINGVYCGDMLIDVADTDTFEVIGSSRLPGYGTVYYGKDRSHVFEAGYVLEGADPANFEIPSVPELHG